MMRTVVLNCLKTAAILLTTVLVSFFLYRNTHGEMELSVVFFLAVVLVAQTTPGYWYGIASAVASVVLINYFFTAPRFAFNFIFRSYPLMFAAMLVASLGISALTSKVKRQAEDAIEREQNSTRLYEENLRLERERDRIRVRAEQEASRGTLLRAVSHDLRTPLTAVSGAASALLENWDHFDEEQKKQLIGNIQTDSDWLIRMVENLLTVTRLQDGITKLEKTPEAAEEVAAEAVRKMRQRFPNTEIGVRLPQEFLLVPMDALLIEQVLINLMENVVRHSGAPERIGLTVGERDGSAVFTIEDWGRGLPNEGICFEELPLSGDRERDMGIGLRVCMTIVRAHGGEISAENKQTGGAVVRFSLPMEEKSHETDSIGD